MSAHSLLELVLMSTLNDLFYSEHELNEHELNSTQLNELISLHFRLLIWICAVTKGIHRPATPLFQLVVIQGPVQVTVNPPE